MICFNSIITRFREQRVALPSPVDSILEAVLIVSPNRQYRGIAVPTTPATHGPVLTPILICSLSAGLWGILYCWILRSRSSDMVAISPACFRPETITEPLNHSTEVAIPKDSISLGVWIRLFNVYYRVLFDQTTMTLFIAKNFYLSGSRKDSVGDIRLWKSDECLGLLFKDCFGVWEALKGETSSEIY